MLKNYLRARVLFWGSEILSSVNMEKERLFMQHGTTDVLTHSFNVACISLFIAYILKLKINERALVRGALLHDYFLYDWHEKKTSGLPHGFTHPKTALDNAMRDFSVSPVEQDIIVRHMFPLTIVPPKYTESAVVCVADKICAVTETLRLKRLIIEMYKNKLR